MKKVAIAAFALMYAVLTLSASSERTKVWIVELVKAASQSSGHSSDSFGKTQKLPLHHPQTRLLEDHLAVAVDPARITDDFTSERYIHLGQAGTFLFHDGGLESLRAPPYLIKFS